MSDVDVIIHVVDDEEAVRNSLAFLLGSSGFAVRTHASAGAFLEIAAGIRNGCLVTDLRMPEIDGVEATRRILALRPDTKVVVLTSFAERPRVVEAIDAGAVGYLLKDAAPEEIVAAIHAAHRGEAPLDPRAARALVGPRTPTAGGAAGTGRGTAPALTDRERQVLGLVAEGAHGPYAVPAAQVPLAALVLLRVVPEQEVASLARSRAARAEPGDARPGRGDDDHAGLGGEDLDRVQAVEFGFFYGKCHGPLVSEFRP